jgi:hypothetical protein
MSIASGLEEVSIAWSDKPGSRQGGSICSNSRGAHALMSKFSSTFNVSINKLAPCTLFVSAVIVFLLAILWRSVIMFLIVLCWQPDSIVGMLDNVTSLAYQAYYRLTNYTLTGNHRKVSV